MSYLEQDQILADEALAREIDAMEREGEQIPEDIEFRDI